MRLSYLLDTLCQLTSDIDREVSSIATDSRKVGANSLFIAVKGTATDGRAYIDQAIAKGAVAVLVDSEITSQEISFQHAVPLIPINNLAQQIGELAARFYDYPAKKLRMIGVTGTNGKTSCSLLIAQCMGEPCGVIGTLGAGIYGAIEPTGWTTPEAIRLHELLHQFVQKNIKTVVMEVSSHSIDQGRVNGIEFEIGLFTNLTQDHLDYHGTMEAYAAVKRRFLAESFTRQVVINVDDDHGRIWSEELTKIKPVFTYSTNETDAVALSLSGLSAAVHTQWGNGELTMPLLGQFNVSNALAVLTVLCVYGISFEEALKRLARAHPIPGRMQMVTAPDMPLVVVDYSHTPDSLEKALIALRGHVQGQLICVFGCGGDRDAAKRPLMGRIAERLADKVIVTNDNPRHESPEVIAAQILQGMMHPERVMLQLDRSQAIQSSIQLAEAGDGILVAGKGAEHDQQIGDIKTHFDDVEEVNKYLAEKRYAVVVK